MRIKNRMCGPWIAILGTAIFLAGCGEAVSDEEAVEIGNSAIEQECNSAGADAEIGMNASRDSETGDGSEEGNQQTEHEPYIPSKEEVLSAREAALEGMTQEQIDRLTENIKVANVTMERAYFYDDIFGKLADKDNFYWDFFDEKGYIQIGWQYDGEFKEIDNIYKEINNIMETENLTREEFNERYCEPVMTYNRFNADNFIELIEDMKKDVVNEELQNDLQSIIDETRLAAESHEMEHANNIFKILHDMDYFLLRYGLDDVDKYSRDDSFIGTYYGTLSFYK